MQAIVNASPRPNREVLEMWSQYDDRELMDWRMLYQIMFSKSPESKQHEILQQDFSAIEKLLRRRSLL